MSGKFDSSLPQSRDGFKPCELRSNSRINDDSLFDEEMTALCVEATSNEMPNDSLLDCKPYVYTLLQVLFRLASMLHYKKQPYQCVCSLLEPSLIVHEDARGGVDCGRVFWVVLPKRLKHWFKIAVLDILMVSNGYISWESTLRTDVNYNTLLEPGPEEEDEEDDDDDEANEEDGTQTARRGKKRKKRKNKTTPLQFAFRNFDPTLGVGTSNMKKMKVQSAVPSLTRLQDFDKCLELYFDHKVPGMPEGDLRPTIREWDTPEAWEARFDLLSPKNLFGSARRSDYVEDIARDLRQDDDESDDEGGETGVELDELLEFDRSQLSPETARSLEQMDPRSIFKDQEGRRISFKHMVAWKLESNMFQPDYFLRRFFPSCEVTDTDVDVAGEKYSHKNPTIVFLKKTFRKLGISAGVYQDWKRVGSLLQLYYQKHRNSNEDMTNLQSYRDDWMDRMNGYLFNGVKDSKTGRFVPHVHLNKDDELVIGYRYLLNLMGLVKRVAGVSNAMGELCYILLSGINQLRPHSTMSMHAILVGPPGTGKTSVMVAAKGVVGSAYSDDVTYRTQKAVLVENSSKYRNSKKMRFMNEFVPPSTSSKNDKNPLAVESSQEAAIMKEELDSGCTRSERTEKMVDPNTGSTRHGVREAVNVCDSATFMAMNEKEVCYSIDTRVTTFDVPPNGTVNESKKTEGFEERLDRYKLRASYGFLRHLVMETSRFIELGLYPRRFDEDDWHCERMLILTWDRLASLLEQLNLKFGLQTDMRLRARVFELTRLLGLIFGVVKIYGCPPKSILDENPKRADENTCCHASRVIAAYKKWVRKMFRHNRKFLHDEVIAESQPDPADLLFAFSLIHPMVQSELVILKTIVDQLVDPERTICKDGEKYFVLVCRTEDSLLETLERKTGVSRKRCKEILSGMQSGDSKSFRCVDDVGQKQQLMLCSVGTEAFMASNDDKYRSISDQMLKQMASIDENTFADAHFLQVKLDQTLAREIKFLSLLRVYPRHTYWNRGGHDPKADVSYARYEGAKKGFVDINVDFYETRLRFLKKRTLLACENGKCDDKGLVKVGTPSRHAADAVRVLTCRSWDGSRESTPFPPSAMSNRDDCELVLKTSTDRVFMVHLSVLLPRWGHLAIPKLCLRVLKADENACKNDRVRVEAANDLEDAILKDALDLMTNDLRHLVGCSSIVNEPSTGVFDVNLLTLNSLEKACQHFKIRFDESVMKNVIEKSIFKNMTQRETVMYFDRSANDVFQKVNVRQLAEKNGGSLPEHACKNPYLKKYVVTLGTKMVDGDDDKFAVKEEALLKAEPFHVERRKAWIRMLADGSEFSLRNKFGKDIDRYMEEVKKREDELMADDREHGYVPLVAQLDEPNHFECVCDRHAA